MALDSNKYRRIELLKLHRMAQLADPVNQSQARADTAANDHVRGSCAIGDNVDIESIRTSNHRENYLGHSILAPVGRSERRRDQLFWARDKASVNLQDDELKREFKEAQIRERRALNEALGRPIDEGIDELLNPKPTPTAVTNPLALKDAKERRHKHRHRRHHRSRSRSPHRRAHRAHRSERERSRSPEHRSDRRHRHRHRHRERERSRSRDERRPRHREISHDPSPDSYRPRHHENTRAASPEDRRRRHRDRENSPELISHQRKDRGDYFPQRTATDREREDSYASDHPHRSRRDSASRY